MPVCFLCRQNFAINILKHHFESVHYNNKDLKTYTCREVNCNRSYNNYLSFQRHWTTNHDSSSKYEESGTKANLFSINEDKLCQASSVSK